jgi:outer membrane protein TolC
MQPGLEREVWLTWKGRSSKGTGGERRRAGAFAALAIACAVARAPSVAHAQTADVLPSARASTAEPVRGLTLDQALGLAKRGNKNLTVQRARLAQVRTNIEQAWSALFPVVTAQGKYSRNYKNVALDFDQLFAQLGVAPAPPAPGAPAAPDLVVTILKENELDGSLNATMPLIEPAAYPALDAAKTGYRSSEAGYESFEDDILYLVAQTFYAAAVSDEVLMVRRSAIDVATATLDNAQTRLTAGTVTAVDVDRAELALVRARQAELEARYGREQSYRALATMIQEKSPLKVQPTESLPPVAETDLDSALRLRPELRGLVLATAAAEAEARAYGWKWAPTLSAFGNAHIGNYVGFTGNSYSWDFGAQLDWTLFDGGNRDAQRHRADAQKAESEARAEVLRDSISDDLADNRSQLGTKREAVKASQRGVALASATLTLVRSQYEAGTMTQVDLLAAQDALMNAEESLAQSRFEAAIADLSLRRTAGTFPPR